MIKITANRISVGKFCPVSPPLVLEIITDTNQWPRWGSTVKRVQLPERYIRQGSKGRVFTAVGIWLPFVIVKFEDGSFWSWKVASINATGHRVQASETGGCYLWFEVPVLAAPYALVCQMALGRIEKLLCE